MYDDQFKHIDFKDEIYTFFKYFQETLYLSSLQSSKATEFNNFKDLVIIFDVSNKKNPHAQSFKRSISTLKNKYSFLAVELKSLNKFFEMELHKFKQDKINLIHKIQNRISSFEPNDYYPTDNKEVNYSKHFYNYSSIDFSNPMIYLDDIFSGFINLDLEYILTKFKTFLESLSNLATGKLKEMADVAKEVLELLQLIDSKR